MLICALGLAAMLQGTTPNVLIHGEGPAGDPGLWRSAIKVDPMTDAKVVTLILGNENHSRALVLRCKGKDLDVYINWGAYVANRDPGTRNVDVIKRLGDGKPDKDYWTPANDHTATFHRGDHKRFVRELLAVDSAVFQVTPFNSPTLIAEFDVRGLANAIGPLQEGCPLK
jgi:type VI secretion system protein VasI